MQLVSFCYLNVGDNQFLHRPTERLSTITAVGQHIEYSGKLPLVLGNHQQCARSVANIGGGDMQSVRQPLRINGDMPLYPGDLLSRIVAFQPRRVGVFNALRVHDDK